MITASQFLWTLKLSTVVPSFYLPMLKVQLGRLILKEGNDNTATCLQYIQK